MLESSVFVDDGGGGSDGVRNEGGSGGPAAEDGDRNSPANRWPRDETLALLKIRSDMDLEFRDSNLKAPLWDEVSRKMGEIGYVRSSKKCREKFENVYKYHKRTKDGRSSKNSKSYRFFEQLELFDAHFSIPSPSPPPNQIPSHAMEADPLSCNRDFIRPCSFNRDRNAEFMSVSTSTSSSSGKESEGSVKKKKKKKKNKKMKRKLAHYFERLMKEVLKKQEDFQNKFLERIEKCEKDRIAREQAWKAQEMERVKREREYLAQERANAAAKDAAVLAFLRKIAQQTSIPLDMPEILNPLFDNPAEKLESILERHRSCLQEKTHTKKQSIRAAGEIATVQMGSSRWPKEEIEALIMLKTDLDLKYQDHVPKGPLWEEISSCMERLGYERNAKRCKEKWENINKYYRRVKDNKKRRPGDSKTCPYFSMLEYIYAKKSKKSLVDSDNGDSNLKPEQILMQMIGENPQKPQAQPLMLEYGDSDHQNQEDDVEDEHDVDDEDSRDGYKIAANNLSSVTTLGS